MPQSPETVARIGQLLQWLLPRCLSFVRHSVREIAPSADGSLAVSSMRLVAAMLPAAPPASSAEASGTGIHLLFCRPMRLLWHHATTRQYKRQQ